MLQARGFDPPHSWHWGFGAAGIGMTLGLVQYLVGGHRLGDAGMHPVKPASAEAQIQLHRREKLGFGIGFAVFAGVALGMITGALPITATQVADAFGYGLLIIAVVFFGWLFFAGDWTVQERRRLYVIGVFLLAAALFWSVFEQDGSTLNLFAGRSTRLEIVGWRFQSSYFQSLNALFNHRVCARVRMVVDEAGPARAVEPGEVFAGPDRRRGGTTVMKLRVSDGAILGTFNAGISPWGMAFDGNHIWVGNLNSNTVTKVRTSDGSIVGSFVVGNTPERIAFDGANIWVANGASNTLSKR